MVSLARAPVCDTRRGDKHAARPRGERQRRPPAIIGRAGRRCCRCARSYRDVAEQRERGYPGSRKLVALWVRARRTAPAPTMPHRHRPADGAATVAPSLAGRRPSARRLAWLLVRAPEDLRPGEQPRLACLEAACPAAAIAYPLIQQFVRMLSQSNAQPLETWLATAAASGVPELQTFATGLCEESSALAAILRLPWSIGPVEGQITRLAAYPESERA